MPNTDYMHCQHCNHLTIELGLDESCSYCDFTIFQGAEDILSDYYNYYTIEADRPF